MNAAALAARSARWSRVALSCLCASTMLAGVASARDITLRWRDPNTDASVVDFLVGVGSSPGVYQSTIGVPRGVTPDASGVYSYTATVPAIIPDDVDVYVAMQAIDDRGVTSLWSNERTFPGEAMPPGPDPDPGGYTMPGGALGGGGPVSGIAQLQSEGFGLSSSVRATAPEGDPRLFVVERAGTIRIVEAGRVLAGRPFLDLSHEVLAVGDAGLLGLAFDPDYASNGYFYVYRVVEGGDGVLSRFNVSTADPYVANPLSELEILRVALPAPGNDSGGGLVFDLDGFLLLGIGDGNGAGDPGDLAQDGGELVGKILRLDVANPPAPSSLATGGAYAIPADNPFVGDGSVRDEIWALGLRHPAHLAVDSETGDLWITDQGQALRQEIDFEPGDDAGGHNYGWDVMEGTACNGDDPAVTPACGSGLLTAPLYEYPLTPGHCEIVGGFVYRGAQVEFQGQYFFADACAGLAWSYDPGGDTVANRSVQFAGSVSRNLHVVGFGVDGLGEGHVLTADGRAYKLRGPSAECSDGVDNDGDGLTDFGADPGCASASGAFENPRCDDGLDNDGDQAVDGDDPQCATPASNVEAEPLSTDALVEGSLCGLGAELVLIIPPLIWLRQRRRQRR